MCIAEAGDPSNWPIPYLESEERVLWTGQPERRAYVWRGSWYMIPWALLWAGGVFAWEATAIQMMLGTVGCPGLCMVVWGIPFVLLGTHLLIGRFWVAAREARRTCYAVTNRRVLLRTGAFEPALIAFPLRSLPYLQLFREPGGRGSIQFTPPTLRTLFAVPGWPSPYSLPPAFLAIRDAPTVYRIICDARQAIVRRNPQSV